jgi:hypothetical protein
MLFLKERINELHVGIFSIFHCCHFWTSLLCCYILDLKSTKFFQWSFRDRLSSFSSSHVVQCETEVASVFESSLIQFVLNIRKCSILIEVYNFWAQDLVKTLHGSCPLIATISNIDYTQYVCFQKPNHMNQHKCVASCLQPTWLECTKTSLWIFCVMGCTRFLYLGNSSMHITV